MYCTGYCLLGAILLGSMIACMLVSKTSGVFKKFTDSLSAAQKKIYQEIVNERMHLYLQGMLLGLVLALIAGYLLNKNKSPKKIAKVCIFVTIALGTCILYYSLSPKSKYMLQYLEKNQINGWLNIYKEMKTRSYVGSLLGILGYVLIGMGTCN